MVPNAIGRNGMSPGLGGGAHAAPAPGAGGDPKYVGGWGAPVGGGGDDPEGGAGGGVAAPGACHCCSSVMIHSQICVLPDTVATLRLQ